MWWVAGAHRPVGAEASPAAAAAEAVQRKPAEVAAVVGGAGAELLQAAARPGEEVEAAAASPEAQRAEEARASQAAVPVERPVARRHTRARGRRSTDIPTSMAVHLSRIAGIPS